uniref:Immunoglobulin V-set domain-containing protein n=1 Tax=Myripristis murdjan TaxID=586833 RepID=A0A667WTD5_9TELE
LWSWRPMCDAINTDIMFGESLVLKRTEGGHITVGCAFSWTKDKKKYFCKGTCRGGDILIETTQDRHQNGRYIIEDTKIGVFYVTITQLTKSDAGTYHCGVDRPIKIEVQDAATTTVVATAATTTTVVATAATAATKKATTTRKTATTSLLFTAPTQSVPPDSTTATTTVTGIAASMRHDFFFFS